MALTFSLLPLFSLSTVIATEDDVIIRQVVPDSNSDIDALLRNADHHFSLFKSKFDKQYDSEAEHEYRLGVFKSNIRRVKRHQAVDPSAVHGVTKFADLTAKEFKEKYLGLKGGKCSKKLKLTYDANDAPTLPTKDLPEDFDWRDKGVF